MMNLKLDGVTCIAGLFNSAHAAQGRRASISRTAQAYELQWVEGESGIVYINDTAYTLSSDSVICLHPGDVCRISVPYRAYYVRIMGAQGELAAMLDAWEDVMTIPQASALIETVCALSECGRREERIAQMAQLLTLLGAIETVVARDRRIETSARKKTRDSIRAGIQYIEEHFREKCTLKEIAAHAERSPIYFHDVFGEVMGMTPYEYIAQLRLEEAKRALSLTDEDPVDIATACGFCSQSYFNYVFKKATGITPLNYRRACAARYMEDEDATAEQ